MLDYKFKYKVKESKEGNKPNFSICLLQELLKIFSALPNALQGFTASQESRLSLLALIGCTSSLHSPFDIHIEALAFSFAACLLRMFYFHKCSTRPVKQYSGNAR
jgi:hypothetical protein